MAKFAQLINREADLQAILDGYEQAIQREGWLAESLQKDGIQNAWGARVNKKGNDWSCNILFRKGNDGFPPTLIIEDTGTTGLTGTIPKDVDEQAKILMSEDPHQRLGRFLSSNWSTKTEHSLGSRGRGKMIFVGASEKSIMYFDSIRSDDNVYVFGATYLDDNKQMQVEIYSDNEAHTHRMNKLGRDFPNITQPGTRIIIPYPKKEVEVKFTNGGVQELIKETWWEILQKYDAKIFCGEFEEPLRVSFSEWLPISNSGISEKKIYNDIDVGNGLKIKRISLVYLKDKSVPEIHQGITIQRSGMKIQTKKIGEYVSELPNNCVYGSVEFDSALDDAMLEVEGPEHYNFFWNKGVASKVHRAIKVAILDFAKEYKIIDSDKPSIKKMRDAEIAVLNELNDIARSLGLSGTGFVKRPGLKPKPPGPVDPIRLQFPDFEIPSNSGRVNYREKITGVYSIGKSDFEDGLKVLVETWIYKESGGSFVNFSIKKEAIIGKNEEDVSVGWDAIEIDDRFSRGRYYLKSRMTSLEDKNFDGLEIKKADVICGEISRSFWVEEEPPARGFWKDTRRADRGKERLVWWQEDGDGYILLWNGDHPLMKEASAGNEEYLQDILRREGTYAFWAVVLAVVQADPDGVNKKLSQIIGGIADASIESQIDWVMQQRSSTLWKK